MRLHHLELELSPRLERFFFLLPSTLELTEALRLESPTLEEKRLGNRNMR